MSATAAPHTTRPARPGVPLGWAAAIGVLAVGAALAAGHLVAAIVSPSSSPYLAVGDWVIRLSPQWLTEFAKTTFGTADKPILLAGMGVVIAIIAAAAGIASRRSPTPGVVVVAVLGVLGFLAVLFAPAFAPLDLVAPAVSLVVGVGVFRLLHGLALRTTEGPEQPASGAGVSRRNVLIGSSAAVGVASLGAAAGGVLLGGGVTNSRQTVTAQLARAGLVERAPAIPPDAAFPGLGTPTFLTPNPDFYRVDVALRIPTQAAQDWSMRIHGMVDEELTLTFDDLLARPLVERAITLTCVSNEVGGPYISTANFIGVDLRELLLEAGVRPDAEQLFSTSIDGWTAGTPVDVVMEEGRDSMLAIGMNGEALPPEHGFPVRMVVPGLYGFVSATKWLTDLEVTTFDAKQSYWLQRGWAQRAPIKTQSRIDSPRAFEEVPAGRVTVAGIAWSQPVGISKVEVRVDGGPWQEAELGAPVNTDTWRMWHIALDLAPGSHTIQSRATDRNGVTQTEVRVPPIPDGASGWPSLIIRVAS
ncbi:molybdopterin-dependent oxidoreductase [Pseudonocardia nigra]|uniref:molybdopterin-dependent oxidoreductase n=1 Tax=Pseudonocardia nigra TaxID=1921578 RepID=UPI001C5CC7BB|nr:molybdopterin-dependent oxidoreductase [Pseudonocardia nigra]